MLRLLALLPLALALAGCPAAQSPAPSGPSGPSGGGGASSGAKGGGGTGANPADDQPIGFQPDVEQACMVHPRTGTYQRCAHGAGGVCFTSGAPCLPEGLCVFEPASGRYRVCTAPLSGGACDRHGDPCAPADRCMVDPASGTHRTCEETGGGRCARYGAPCMPSSGGSGRPNQDDHSAAAAPASSALDRAVSAA